MPLPATALYWLNNEPLVEYSRTWELWEINLITLNATLVILAINSVHKSSRVGGG